MTVVRLLLLPLVIHLQFAIVKSAVEVRIGHYPVHYCTFDDVILRTDERQFFYKSDTDLHYQCDFVRDMWPLSHSTTLSSASCDKEFDVGHIFTIYYYFGSNYFHLHFDFLIPLYGAIYHEPAKSSGTSVFMPSVETVRQHKIDWDTVAFSNSSKYWIQMLMSIVGQNEVIPLDNRSIDHGDAICLKKAHFGIPSVQFGDRSLIRGFVAFIQKSLNITVNTNVEPRVGVISRSNRRRIVNEDEVIAALNTIAPTDKVEFSGMTFHDQVALMQQYAILIGMNGAGLTNGLYLPPGGVVIQLVPSGVDLNVKEFGNLLRGGAGGGYMEWQNKHESNAVNSNGDTVVDISELMEITHEALEMFQQARQQLGTRTEL